MSDLAPRNMAAIRTGTATPSQLHEAIVDTVNAVNNLGQQTNASPVGQTPPPPAHSALKVTGGGGYFRAEITDNSPSYRGKENFLEVSESTTFSNPHVIHLGAAKSAYLNLGAKNLHFRSYAAHPTTGPSTHVYAMNVSGGGTKAPSVSGVGPGGEGFGRQPYTTPKPPIR